MRSVCCRAAAMIAWLGATLISIVIRCILQAQEAAVAGCTWLVHIDSDEVCGGDETTC